MKKIAFLLVSVLALGSCSVDDDSSNLGYELAVVQEADFPEFFEMGEVYNIDVTYTLPSACHNSLIPNSLDVRRGSTSGDLRREIYVMAWTSYDPELTDCNAQEDDLDKTESFRILIDEDEDYTFHLWTGSDNDGKAIYTEVTVPVGQPQENTESNN